MRKSNNYKTYKVYTLTPNKKEDLEFEVLACVSCSDESDVGLSSCEISIDIDGDYLEVISDCEGYTKQELKEYLESKLNEDSSFVEEQIYEQYCDNRYYDEVERAELASVERYERELEK